MPISSGAMAFTFNGKVGVIVAFYEDMKSVLDLIEPNILKYGLTEDNMQDYYEIIAELNDMHYNIGSTKNIPLEKQLMLEKSQWLREQIKQKVEKDFEGFTIYEVKDAIGEDEMPITNMYYELLRFEAPYLLDSFIIYIEKNRPIKEQFYIPRRKTLKQVVDAIQELADDLLDELFIHMPARVGKSQIITLAMAWWCARQPNKSNLYITYKEGLGGAFLDGVREIYKDPQYCYQAVFPEVGIVSEDGKNHKMDLKNPRKYKTLSGKGMESGLNGEYDCNGLMVNDDVLEGIQDVLNPDRLKRKQLVFDNNVTLRCKEGSKKIFNGTIWSLKDIYMDRVNYLQTNPAAAHIRYKIIKIPALNENDESNFDYEYGVGFSTQYYKALRAKFEANDDMAGWYAQCQQEPIERDGAVFVPDDMHYYNGILPPEEPVRIFAACDVALGGEDFLSMPIAYEYEDGTTYIHDVVFDNREKRYTKPQVISKLIENNCGSAFFEANQGGEGYKDEVDMELRAKGYRLNLESKYAPTNKRKSQRIWDKAGSIRDYVFRDTSCRSPEYQKFMTNLFSFTMTQSKRKHEDAADSLATLAAYQEGSWRTTQVDTVFNPFWR